MMYYMEVFEKLVSTDVQYRDVLTNAEVAPPEEHHMRHPEQDDRFVAIWLCKGEFEEDGYLRYARKTGLKAFTEARSCEICQVLVSVTWLIDAGYIPPDQGFQADGYTSWEGVFQLTQRQHICISAASAALYNNQYNDATRIMRGLSAPPAIAPRFVERSTRQITWYSQQAP
jgi:hypothetical protein